MLLRQDSAGVLAIGQASHAWISGQLARAWGNERFGPIEPREEVCLAAEQHDVGMAAWDLEPTRNPDTGLPHSFLEMPIATHLELWRAGPRRLLSQSRYAAVLVALHGHRLYEHRDLTRLAEPDADGVRAFLRDSRGFERRLIGALRADAATAPSAETALLRRNSDLLRAWDALSLQLCLGRLPGRTGGVPTPAVGAVELTLEPMHDQPGNPVRVCVDPWPFTAPDAVHVRCEGRRLTGRSDSDEALEQALAAAPWETLEFRLRPRSR